MPIRKRRLTPKRLIVVFAGFLLIIALAVWGGSRYLRSENFNRYVAEEVKSKLKEYGLRGEIGGLGFTLSDQRAKLRDLKIYNDQTGRFIASIDQVELLFEIREPYALRLSRDIALNKLSLDGLKLAVEIDQEGRTNFEGLRSPPSVKKAISFDPTQLLISISDGAFHFKDSLRDVEADLTRLNVTAQPQSQNPLVVRLQLASAAGRVIYEGRETKIDKLDFTARATGSGSEFEQLNLVSGLGQVKAKGRLDDWKAIRYRFDFDSRVNMGETARLFSPRLAIKGLAAVRGDIEGEGGKYRIRAAINSDDVTIENTRLRNLQIAQINFDAKGKQIDFSSNQARSQSVSFSDVRIDGVAINNIKGEYRNGRTLVGAPGVGIASIEWPQSRLSNLTLVGLTAAFDSSGRRFGYEVRADANLKEGAISGVSFNNATTLSTYDNTALRLTEIKADVLGGSASGDFTLPIARGAVSTAKFTFTDLQTKDALAVLNAKDSGSEIPLTGKFSGEGEVSFIGSEARTIDGRVNARFEGQANENSDALPLTGEAAIEVEDGVFNFQQLRLSTDASKLRASGKLSVDGDYGLLVNLTSTKAEEFLQIGRSIDAARKTITEYEPQLIGDFKFDGCISGNGDKVILEGDVNAATVGLRDGLLGALTGHIYISQTELRVENGLVSAANGGSMKFDLFTPLDSKAETGKLDATLERMNLETILAALGSPDANRFISGDITGETHLMGLPASLNGNSRVNLVSAKISGQPAETAEAVLKFDGKNALLENLVIQLPQSRLTASGEMNLDDYSFKLRGKASQISLERLAEAFELKETRIEGAADADLVISGKVITEPKPDLDWDSLQVYLLAQGKGIKVNGRDAGELKLGAQTSAGGRLEFGLATGILSAAKASETNEKPEVIRGNIELRKSGRPVLIESELVEQDLAPLFELFAPDLNRSIAGKVSGKLRIEGPTTDENGNGTFDRLSGGLRLTDASFQFANNNLKVETPVTVGLEAMQIKVGNTRFTGQGVDLNLGGVLGLSGDAGMDFILTGTINLGQVPAITDNLLLNGLVTVDAKLNGKADAPALSGQVDLSGFGFSSSDLPFFVSDGSGNITLSGDQIKLNSFKAKANDGALEADGVMKLVDLSPAEWRYNIKADNATVDYQDLTANLSGSLTLSGAPQGQVLAGTITMPQAEYSPNIDLDNLIGSGNRGFSFGGLSSGKGGAQTRALPPTNLNLRLEARDSLIVRTEQINAAGSALLTIGGRISDPALTGRIETDSGSVRFRGQRYEITVGSLDLPPGSGNPLLNLNAEGDVGGYRVTIGFVGPIDDIDLTLRSEPQLVRDEIIALITTGRTESGSLIGGQDPLRSSVGAAASLLSSGFISKPTEQLLGLSRFQIDPVIRPNSNPAARLTVGQQISRNVYLSYSTNLATEQDQTALAEYTFSNRFSALATFTQGGSATRQGVNEGVFTIELRGRKRFSLGFQPSDPLASAGVNTPATTDPLAPLTSIARAKLPSATVQVTAVPDLKLNDRKLRELLPVKTQGFSRSLARLGEKRLREFLQESGYFFADVRYRCEPENCGGDDLRLFYDIEPNAIYDLKEIRLEGTQQIKLSEIKGELQSQTASNVGGIPFLKDLPLIGGYVRGLTSNDRLKADEELIRQHLADDGFRNARVKSRLAVKPDNDELLVIFDVAEGIQAGVAGVKFHGNVVMSLEEVREAAPFQQGEAYSLTRAHAGIRKIRQLYAQNGFLETAVELELVDVSQDNVLLVYKLDEGPRAVVTEIEINGLTKTGKGWVRRYLDFNPGETLTPGKIQQTQRNLYATNAFREVTLRAESIGGDDGSAHRVSLNLTEAKPLLLVYGLGYSTDDGPRGLMEIANTNVNGSLDSLTLRMRASRLEQFAQLAFTDLRPFGWRWPTTVSVFYNRNTNLRPLITRRVLQADGSVVDEDVGEGLGYQRFAAFIQTERKLGERTSLRFRYNLERANLFGVDPNEFPDVDVARAERAIRLGMFSAGFSHDTRDSVINPTRGQLFSADHSIAARIFGGNESFNKFFGTYQAYRTLDPNTPFLKNSTLAFAARVGLAAVFRFADRDNNGMIEESEQHLPITERFFTGGATTLRGFRFETAGPQDILEPRPDKRCDLGVRPCDLPTLVPIGGDAITVFNFELRYPLSRRFRLVPFYDLGNGFRKIGDINFSNMTHTIGLGLRINTPLGPVGVDYGFLIDPPAYVTRDGAILRQPRGAFHIRLGQSF